MIANLLGFDTAVMSSANFAISSLMNWLPFVLIALISLWGVKSFFDYIIYKSRSSLKIESTSGIIDLDRNFGSYYDRDLMDTASLTKIDDEDVDYSTFTSFFEEDGPHAKYGVDSVVWKLSGAEYYYKKNDGDFFTDEKLSDLRQESRNRYWSDYLPDSLSYEERNKKYKAYCRLQDEHSCKSWVG